MTRNKLFSCGMAILFILASYTILHARELPTAEVELTYRGSNFVQGGMVPVDILISPKTDSVQISISATGKSNVRTTLWHHQKTFTVQNQKKTTVTLLCPFSVYTELIEFTATDRTGEEAHLDNLDIGTENPDVMNFIYTGNPGTIESFRMTGDPSQKGSFSPWVTPIQFSHLWDRWQAYSWVDSILIRWNDLKRLPAGKQQAIYNWIGCEGNLIVLNLPGTTTKQKRKNIRDAGFLPPKLTRLVPPPNITSGSLHHYAYLNGNIYFANDEVSRTIGNYFRHIQNASPSSSNDPSRFSRKLSFLESNVFDWHSRNGWQKGNSFQEGEPVIPSILNIKELTRVPVLSALGLLFLFVTLIGPANYFYLKKKNKMHLLLVTIPVLSILTTTAIFAWDLFKHGLGSDVRTLSVITIDHAENRSVRKNRFLLYMGLSPSEGLTFDNSTRVLPLSQKGEDPEQPFLYSQESDRQIFGGRVGQARTPLFFDTENTVSFRGRLNVQKQDGSRLKVTNGLGFDLHCPLITDRKNRVYIIGGKNPEETTIKQGETRTFQQVRNQYPEALQSGIPVEGESAYTFWKNYYLNDRQPDVVKDLREIDTLYRLAGTQKCSSGSRRYFGFLKKNFEPDYGVESADEHGRTVLVFGQHWQPTTGK